MILDFLRKVKRTLFPDMYPRLYLLRRMPKNAVCAEIGAWEGGFSETILKKTKPSKFYIIDPYMYVPDYTKAWYGGDKGQVKMDKIYESVKQRFSPEIEKGQVEMIRKTSDEALNSFKNNALDWVYIDGNHKYEFVIEDLKNSWKKVKVGGFITGDDYGAVGWWGDGVTKAVHEFIDLKKDSMKTVALRETQFILQKLKD